jgi:hypothetical protein
MVGEGGAADMRAIERRERGATGDVARGARERVRDEAAQALGESPPEEYLETDGATLAARVVRRGLTAPGADRVGHVEERVVEHTDGARDVLGQRELDPGARLPRGLQAVLHTGRARPSLASLRTSADGSLLAVSSRSESTNVGSSFRLPISIVTI